MRIPYYSVVGIEFAVRASGLPHAKSWEDCTPAPSRCNKLAAAPRGSGHDCFLGGIVVLLVIEASWTWWRQWDRYEFVWDVSGTSIMHGNPEAEEEALDKLPLGTLHTRAIVTNYRALKTMYAQRKNHRLKSWRIFCEWIKGLEMSPWITGEEP